MNGVQRVASHVRPASFDILTPYKGSLVVDCENIASTVYKKLSGKWVDLETNRLNLADEGSTYIFGWALIGDDLTASATAGATKVRVCIDREIACEMPLDTAHTQAQLLAIFGDTCDLLVTSNIQYADTDASADDLIQIIGWNYYGSALGAQTVITRVAEAKMTYPGVA